MIPIKLLTEAVQCVIPAVDIAGAFKIISSQDPKKLMEEFQTDDKQWE